MHQFADEKLELAQSSLPLCFNYKATQFQAHTEIIMTRVSRGSGGGCQKDFVGPAKRTHLSGLELNARSKF